MISTIGAAELEDRIRRRIEAGSNSFSSSEVLDAAKSAMNRLYTKMRLVNRGHEHEELYVAPTEPVAVAGRQWVADYRLPEWVGEVTSIEGLIGGGSRSVPIPRLDSQIVSNAWGVRWQWLSSRPGIVRFHGQLSAFSSIALTIVRAWAPLHYGTAAGGSANTITFSAAPNGKLIRRDDVYIGMDVLITNDDPPGVIDQMGRIIDYVGSTRVATVEVPWGIAPTSATQYGLVPPVAGEFEELLIEEAAQILKEEFSEPVPPSPRLTDLRDLFEDGLARRDAEPARLFNRGP